MWEDLFILMEMSLQINRFDLFLGQFEINFQKIAGVFFSIFVFLFPIICNSNLYLTSKSKLQKCL